jgi:hypothetical protein
MKKAAIISTILILSGCSSPNTGNIDNATVLNWENEMVTSEQFVKDHKKCLGVDRPAHAPRSRIAKLLMPNSGNQMPNWEGMWVTFQSNENTDIPQRYLMSSPPGTTSKSLGAYRKCMFKKGYLLRAQ